MRLARTFSALCVMAAFLLAACNKPQHEAGPAERAGEKVDKGMSKLGEKMEEGGQKLQDKAHGD